MDAKMGAALVRCRLLLAFSLLKIWPSRQVLINISLLRPLWTASGQKFIQNAVCLNGQVKVSYATRSPKHKNLHDHPRSQRSPRSQSVKAAKATIRRMTSRASLPTSEI